MAFYSLSENPSIYDADGDGYGGSRHGYSSLFGDDDDDESSSDSSSGSGSSSSSSSSSGSGSSESDEESSPADKKSNSPTVVPSMLKMASGMHRAPEPADLAARPKRKRDDLETTQPNSIVQSPISPPGIQSPQFASLSSFRRGDSFRMDISTSGSASTTAASPSPNGYSSPQAPPQQAITPT